MKEMLYILSNVWEYGFTQARLLLTEGCVMKDLVLPTGFFEGATEADHDKIFEFLSGDVSWSGAVKLISSLENFSPALAYEILMTTHVLSGGVSCTK
jgi:hypothetical protein